MKKKKTITLMVIFILLLTILPIINGKNLYTTIKGNIESRKYRSSLSQNRQDNYNKMKIDYVDIKSRITGTEPFNDGEVSDSNGRDVSAKDDYVRTFDVVKYTLDLGIGTNNNEAGVNDSSVFKGGVIKVKAKLPNQGETTLMTWEPDAWMQNVSYNEDKTEIYAEYHVPEDISITNANQNLTFTVKVSGYKKEVNDDMAPIFEVWMEGNGPDDQTSDVDSVIVKDKHNNLIISGKPSYDVVLKPSTYLYNGVRNNVSGYYISYGVGISMVQPESNLSDLRGVEYPTGKFQIELENKYLARDVYNDNNNYVEVGNDTPNSLGILNNTSIVAYSLNGTNNDNYYPTKKVFTRDLPYGSGGGKRSVTNSGNMSVSLNKDITTISFVDYELDGKYPTNHTHSTDNVINFPGNIGYFATGNIQMFVPYYAPLDDVAYNYSYNIKLKSIKYNDSNGKTYELDGLASSNKNNDEIGIGFSKYGLKGSFYVQTMLQNNSVTPYDGLSSSTLGGFIYPVFTLMPVDGPYEGGAERIIKWNSKYFTLNKQDKEWFKIECNSEIGFACPSTDTISIKYGVFKNNLEEGITDDALVNSLNKDSFDWYDTFEEANSKGKVTALLGFDSEVVGNRVHRRIKIKLGVTNDEKLIGTVGTIVHRTTIYGDKDKSLVYTPHSDVNYIETQYNEDGNVMKNHSPSTVGTSVLILGAKTNITSSVTDLDSDGDLKKAYDVKDNEINLNLKLGVTNDKPALDNDKYLDSVIVKSTLPSGLSYKEGSANKEPKSIELNEDGSSVIIWEYKDWQINHQAPEFSEITYKAEISAGLDNNSSLLISSEIINKEDLRDSQFRTNAYGVVISNLSGSRASKEASKTIIDTNDNFSITNTIGNTSQDTLQNIKTISLLPKDNDKTGSTFNGEYTLKISSINELQRLYYTTNSIDNIGTTLDVNGKITIKDLDLENDNRWIEVKEGDIVPAGATALASIIQYIEPNSEIKFSYDVYTTDNKPKDTYVFSMNVTSDNLTSAIKTNTVIIKVISRNISGLAFVDNNKDNLYDTNDKLLDNIKVNLLDSDKKLISSTTTNKNGEYKFDDLVKGKYFVEFDILDKYQVIEKSTTEMSSKVDYNGISDLINHEMNEEVSNIDNINLGVKLKEGKVIVHHYIDGTNDKICEDSTNEYLYGDSYETNICSTIPNNYILNNKTDNYKGVINNDNIEVVYSYKKKDSSIESILDKKGLNEISSSEELIDYTIKYDLVVKDYIGNGTITIVDYLPYDIDLDKSDLDGGIYDNSNKTITWNIPFNDIDTYNGNDTKNILKNLKIKYNNIEIKDIVNKVEAKVILDNNEDTKSKEFVTKIKIPSTIITHYYLEGTTDKITDSMLSKGFVGEVYDSIPKEIEGYELTKQPREMYVYELDEKVIIYEYRKIDNPNTGDNITKYIVLGIGSILIMLLVVVIIKKRNKS